MNKMNVFSYAYRKRYYITHPWKFIKETGQNFYAAWHRATRGWAARDAWELGPQLLQILPEMLRYLEKYHCGVPCDMTDEEWTQWLHKMADDIELLQEENWEKQNEYNEEFYRVSENCCAYHDERGYLTVTWSDTPDDKEICNKWMKRAEELNEQWQVMAEEVGKSFFKAIPKLWDQEE